MKPRTVILLPLLSLAACSGAPDQEAVTAALARTYDESLQAERKLLKDFGMEGLLPRFVSAEKLACATSETGRGYDCDVRVTTDQFGENSTRVVAMRLVEGSDGWYVADSDTLSEAPAPSR